MAQAIIKVTLAPGWEKDIDKGIDAVLDDLTEEIKDDIKRGAPMDTGELAASVKRRGHRVFIGGKTGWYWHFVEYGTKPHGPIVPRTKQALWGPNLSHPIARVSLHPGQPAQPFIRPALKKNRRLQVPSGMI